MLAFVDRVAFTSCPATLISTLPSLGPLSPRPNICATPIRSFTASFKRPDSGLSAQPLATVCSTWLSIDPGLPSLALTLPTLNPLSCVLPLVMVPSTAALSLVTSLLPSSASHFLASTSQLCAQLRARLHASSILCRSMHQRTILPLPAAIATQLASPPIPILPPVHGVDFTLPGSTAEHSPTAALPWLLSTLDALGLLTQTNPLRAFVITIPCSAATDDISALSHAVHSHCSNTNWISQCNVVNTAAAGDLVCSIRWLAIGHRSAAPPAPSPFFFPQPADSLRAAYGPLVQAARNNRDEALLALRADTLQPSAPPASPPRSPARSSFAPPVLPLVRPLARSADQTLIIDTPKIAVPFDQPPPPPVLPLARSPRGSNVNN